MAIVSQNAGKQGVFVTSGRNSGEIESVFHYQLCKTNPILSAVGGLQMNVNLYNTKDYENKSDWTLGQNKPNSNPNKPNSNPIAERVKLMQSLYLQRIMKEMPFSQSQKTNPIQTQTNPISASFFLCLAILANTIYGVLPNFLRQTLSGVSGVKVGLLQRWFFSVGKTVFAATLYNFSLYKS